MASITTSLFIAFHDGGGEAIAPTASFTPQAGFPLANLQTSWLWERCLTPAGTVTGVQLDIDLGTNTLLSSAGLFGSNVTASGTKRFRAGTVAGFGSGVVRDSGTVAIYDTSLGAQLLTYVPPWGNSIIDIAPTDYTARYLRWNIDNSGNPDNYLSFGVARWGLGWQPGYSFDESWTSADKKIGPPGCEKILRGHQLNLAMLTEAEAYRLAGLFRSALSTRRMMVVPRPLRPSTWREDAIWASVESVYERAGRERSGGRFFTLQVTFREAER
jgi:hypothetical protein